MKDGYKRTPSYWWNFEWIGRKIAAIVVKSDDNRFPIVGRFFATQDGGLENEEQITSAEKLIKDLNDGRKDPRKCYKNLSNGDVN